MDNQCQRPVPGDGKTPRAPLLVDAELELLRALEEDVLKERASEEEKEKEKNVEKHGGRGPIRDDDDEDYDDSDDE
ncbi:unnamed protein product [Hyaloperonospora brassicae]|uniref:Uncharacterized protein n=1 Tax=Hyaloperonospora brassicae TaxID=162125 RepID=A0AAV0TRJ7_HYABA|nr:unnamed protein product [Hyaloperonospora brassicae]